MSNCQGRIFLFLVTQWFLLLEDISNLQVKKKYIKHFYYSLKHEFWKIIATIWKNRVIKIWSWWWEILEHREVQNMLWCLFTTQIWPVSMFATFSFENHYWYRWVQFIFPSWFYFPYSLSRGSHCSKDGMFPWSPCLKHNICIKNIYFHSLNFI